MSYSPPASAKPFTLNISDQAISEWRQLLQLSKLAPDTFETQQEDRRFGVTHKWLSETKDYWLNKYDWRAQEKHINSVPHYKMQIEFVHLHFTALFSENKDAVPILFMHGWPGSFLEFLPMLQLIKTKYSTKHLPYHIIVPSLPGFTLSTIQSNSDWTNKDTGRILNQLMLTLGFNKYLVQGGDVGSFVAQVMSATYDGCVGMHLNMLPTAGKPDENTPLSNLEKEALARTQAWEPLGMGYAIEHGSRPSTIANVLSSNPLAILAWIGEKFLEWTDEDPSIDEILTNVSLYWFTNCITRSIYTYRELFRGGVVNIDEPAKSDKPLGISWFQFEFRPIFESVAAKNHNLVFYKQHERGGHFAALERPNELFEDVEAFVSKAWKV
ncbi:epoxide hydrolase protein [Pyrenophora tritici-repentis]|nr:epoxide hydrolase protein [Pyrenophora tritici-repentis]KAI2481234.1 epoxide hydrolase protein [Pyrenophora tritici-repentis]